jgi:hypothetical protein
MATPMSASQWTEALKSEGVHAVYQDGWTKTGRDQATGKPFGPVNGIVIHHTAGSDSRSLVTRGTADLPGPLCHAHLAKDGTLTMISMNRVNHAGSIAQNAYDAVVAEAHKHPQPDLAEPVDGNDHFYGIEIENLGNGRDPYPKAQYEQAVRWAAAICRHHGWSENSVVGHKEVTRRKIDPSFPMDLFRIDVCDRLSRWKETPVAKVPGKDVEAARPQAYRDVFETDAIPAPSGHPDSAANKFWTAESYFKFIAEELIRQRGSGS